MTIGDIGQKLVQASGLFMKTGLMSSLYGAMRNSGGCSIFGGGCFGGYNPMMMSMGTLGMQSGMSGMFGGMVGGGYNMGMMGGGYNQFALMNNQINAFANYEYANDVAAYQAIAKQGQVQGQTQIGQAISQRMDNKADAQLTDKSQKDDKAGYATAFKNAGKSLGKFIDYYFGKKDGNGVDKDDGNGFLDAHKIDKTKGNFDKFDTNKDGKLDDDEMTNVLNAMDKDHDGTIKASEFTDWSNDPSTSTLDTATTDSSTDASSSAAKKDAAAKEKTEGKKKTKSK